MIDRKSSGFVSSIMGFLDDLFVLPQPVIAVAVVMMIGTGVGLYSTDLQSFYADESYKVMEIYVLMKDDTQLGGEL